MTAGRAIACVLKRELHFLVLALGLLVGWWWLQPSPYAALHVWIEPDVIAPGDPLDVHVRLTRSALCPYRIERRVVVGGVKVYDRIHTFSTPRLLGTVAFVAPIRIDRLRAVTGAGHYEVRVGAMCNPLRSVWPLWSDWKDAWFMVKDASRINQEDGR